MKNVFKVYNTATGEYPHLGSSSRSMWTRRSDAQYQADRANGPSNRPDNFEVHEFGLRRVDDDSANGGKREGGE